LLGFLKNTIQDEVLITWQGEVKIRKGIKKPDRKIYQVRSVSKLSPEYFETQREVKQKSICKKDTMEKICRHFELE
jgi:hypothetical protein